MIRLAFYVLVLTLAFIHAFITFRGLSSTAGMDQAQIARELARGHGFSTQVIRPYAWRQLLNGKADPSPVLQADTYQPPLQPLLWAPVLKASERWWSYKPEEGSVIYLPDRIIACLGIVWLLLTLWLTHSTVAQLFDRQIAAVTVVALALCEPLWEVAVDGSPRCLLMLLVAVSFRAWTAAAVRAQAGQPVGGPMLVAGLGCMLAVMTHWAALWIVLGFVIATAFFLSARRSAVLPIILLPALALGAWGWRNYQLCGDPLGAMKTTFQSMLMSLPEDAVLRDFTAAAPAVSVDDIVSKVGFQFRQQLESLYGHLGMCLPALFFIAALFHRFRRPDAGAVRWAALCVWGALLFGLSMTGIQKWPFTDNDLHCVAVPLMSGFGAAMLAVLWSRFQPAGSAFWLRSGHAVVAVVITALPMFTALPNTLRTGLFFKDQLVHWPPYAADRVARIGTLVQRHELTFSDAPWFVAWYADRPCAWLPMQREQFAQMRALAEENGAHVPGIVVTPVSAMTEHVGDVYANTWQAWPDLVLRGPLLGLEKDIGDMPGLDFNAVYPLVATPVGNGPGLNVLMAFYADKVRWGKPSP